MVPPDTKTQSARGNAHKTNVAIVGTGLAGLTTAYLLQNDEQQRYNVTLFEQADSLAFDAASVAVKNEKTGAVERIDLPMRACAGGYYANLLRMYDYLGVPLHPVRFLFVFAKALSASQSQLCEAVKPGEAGSAAGSYFVHASNLHQTPPPWPAGRGLVLHIFEILYLIVCHFWFSVVCFLVPPITAADTRSNGGGKTSQGGETFGAYLQRAWVPRRYVSHYLLPLMSSVSTCDHADMLAFPAGDVVNYKRLSTGQQHYAVCGGVHQVQSRLTSGLNDIRLGSRVISVEADAGDDVLVRWQSASSAEGEISEERFDRLVLAVSPDVAGRIFRPLSTIIGKMPTKYVESSVLGAQPGAFSIVDDHEDLATGCSHHGADQSPSQVITFRTLFSEHDSRSEALHAMPGGVLVSTCPLEPTTDAKAVLKTAGFTRTLRSPASRAITQRLMGDEAIYDGSFVNGQDNVWLAGSWCWDGMVLLEGCVVSAMRAAEGLGARIPWDEDK